MIDHCGENFNYDRQFDHEFDGTFGQEFDTGWDILPDSLDGIATKENYQLFKEKYAHLN